MKEVITRERKELNAVCVCLHAYNIWLGLYLRSVFPGLCCLVSLVMKSQQCDFIFKLKLKHNVYSEGCFL